MLQRRKAIRRRKAEGFISQPTPLRRPVVLIVPFVAAVVLETISVKREPSADASIGISMGPPRHTRGVWKSAPAFTKRKHETQNLKDKTGDGDSVAPESVGSQVDYDGVPPHSVFACTYKTPPLISPHTNTDEIRPFLPPNSRYLRCDCCLPPLPKTPSVSQATTQTL